MGVQGIDQLPDRPVAKGVLLERPADERSPFVVHDDVAVAGVADEFLFVEVAERCPVGCAAALGLGVHALEHFGRQVVGVVLGDVGHHVVEQLARRGLVNRLSDRDELGARAGNRGVDLDVIGAVARQPVDLVYEHVVDALGLQLPQHRL
nr:hypothetical protein [Micromonospora tarapacensis]